FAADVQRYLDDEPVRACPPSAWYQFRKFARRNKVILTTTTVVAAALMTTAIALAISNARIRQEVQRAGQEVQRADAEKARAGKNLKLAMDSLDELYTDLAERGLAEEPHLEPLRHKYLERALVFYRKFATENSADPAVGLETAKAESRLAHILYLLGNRAEAEKAFQQAIARFEELGSDAAAGEDVRKALAPCLFNFAALLRHTRR